MKKRAIWKIGDQPNRPQFAQLRDHLGYQLGNDFCYGLLIKIGNNLLLDYGNELE